MTKISGEKRVHSASQIKDHKIQSLLLLYEGSGSCFYPRQANAIIPHPQRRISKMGKTHKAVIELGQNQKRKKGNERDSIKGELSILEQGVKTKEVRRWMKIL